MATIKKITDKQGNAIYLRTHTKAVFDDNGYTAESRLQAMQDEINAKQLEVGAVSSDLTPTENSTNWVTSGGIYNQLYVRTDETQILSVTPTENKVSTHADTISIGNKYTITFSNVSENTSATISVGNTSSASEIFIQGSITEGQTLNVTSTVNATHWRIWRPTGSSYEVTIVRKDAVMVNDVLTNVDSEPIYNSKNLVTSDGVYRYEPLMNVIVPIDSSKMESLPFYINNAGQWYTNGSSVIIPCTEGDVFRLTLTSSDNGNWQTWLNSSYTSPSYGTKVPFVSGYDRIWVSPSDVVLTAPKGAHYLLLGTLTGDKKTGTWVGDATVATKISNVVNTKVTSEYVQNVKTEIEKEVEETKYSMTPYTDVWSTTNASYIFYEKDGEDAVVTVTSKTAKQRCGFSIADVKVGEKIYVDFSSNIGVPFGVGETLSNTYIYIGEDYTSSFYFTKTSTTQKYIYIPANSFSAGTVIRLEGFKVYKAAGPSEFDFRIAKLESHDFYPSSYIPIKEKYETYMSISGTQGSTIYGNYFIQGFAENAKINIYNLETKTLVQEVTLPTFGNTRFHANTISFSGTKYDSGDDFPLLYICAGYVNTNNPTVSEVYVVRIIGESGSYTTELIQTINLAFSTWTEFVCDPVRNRAWINGSGIAKYICVAIPDITESEVTIDANTTIIDKFDTKSFVLGTTTKSIGQGRFFYHNRVYYVSGVPGYAGEGVEALYVVVDNVLTHCTEAVVPLMNFGLTGEPEGCFIWKDEFYVAYQSSIVKLIQN